MMTRVLLSCAACGALLAGIAVAQQPAASAPANSVQVPPSALAMMPPRMKGDTMSIQTNVGSFKILPKGDAPPAGKLDVSFTGTVLVSGLQPGSFIKTFGNVRREYNEDRHGKQVYFGTGRLLIVGKFLNCQWFGRNLKFAFTGSAIVRIIAEFDKDLNTGYYWFDPAKKIVMQNALQQVEVPDPFQNKPRAIPRDSVGKGKGGA